MTIVDIVNFNADASCLSSTAWLAALEGGEHSSFCRWLALYPELGRKVSLGIVGSTLAELQQLNPEAIAFLNAHPEIFELLVRPFAHDVALLRSPLGFERNLELGLAAIDRICGRATPYFLPPEFMLMSEQVSLLVKHSIEGVFVNAARLRRDVSHRIPLRPYVMTGVLDARLNAIPIQGQLTDAYLASIRQFTAEPWNAAIATLDATSPTFSWRDGETAFFVPEGIERERAWLEQETGARRAQLGDALPHLEFVNRVDLPPPLLHAYPPHSFAPWAKELRMFGFLQRVTAIEDRLAELTVDEVALWLHVIGSDVLSAVEKEPPIIQLHRTAEQEPEPITLWRSERGFEGEEVLVLLEQGITSAATKSYLSRSDAPHIIRLRARMDFLRQI